jgi:L-2-hydroxycarboxylate dehydrogenase (NAD+)
MGQNQISPARAKQYVQEVFAKLGMPHEDTLIAAEYIVRADLIGADGHGLFRMPQYVARILQGGMNVHAQIKTIKDSGPMALLDGDNGLGHLVMYRSTILAIEKAKEFGIGWVGSNNGNHSGAGAHYVNKIADAGLVGIYLAVGSANHMAPTGGSSRLLSTNPIAFGVPVGSGKPHMILDMATTVTAFGKIKVKAQKNEPMPVGWMIDAQGQPITDPKKASEGTLLPIGDHKGYGLALMIGMLAGCMNGGAMGSKVVDFNKDSSSITNTGQTMIAINPDYLMGREYFLNEVSRVVDELHASATLPGVDRIRVPGEGAMATESKRTQEGIPLTPELRNALNECAQSLGVSLI